MFFFPQRVQPLPSRGVGLTIMSSRCLCSSGLRLHVDTGKGAAPSHQPRRDFNRAVHRIIYSPCESEHLNIILGGSELLPSFPLVLSQAHGRD